MNNAGLVARGLREFSKPKRVVDIGAGDGSFSLRLATLLEWRDTEFVLVDRNSEISPTVRDGFRALSCRVQFSAVMRWRD